MNIKKIGKNSYSNWEVTPRKKNLNTDALKSAEKTPISFSDVKKKYSNVKTSDAAEMPNTEGIDKEWKSAFIGPKDKTVDTLLEEKMHFFDESGNEVASQG